MGIVHELKLCITATSQQKVFILFDFHYLMNTIKQVLGPEMNQREKAARRKSSGLSEKNINQVQLEVEEEVFRT